MGAADLCLSCVSENPNPWRTECRWTACRAWLSHGWSVSCTLCYKKRGVLKGMRAGRDRHLAMVHLSDMQFILRRVPEDCPQGVADLWQACIAVRPSVRPSAANVQAALKRMQSVMRPAPLPPAQAATAPSTAACASGDAPQAAERAAQASRSGVEQAGGVLEGGAGASGVPPAEQPASRQHAKECRGEGQAAALRAARRSARTPG